MNQVKYTLKILMLQTVSEGICLFCIAFLLFSKDKTACRLVDFMTVLYVYKYYRSSYIILVFSNASSRRFVINKQNNKIFRAIANYDIKLRSWKSPAGRYLGLEIWHYGIFIIYMKRLNANMRLVGWDLHYFRQSKNIIQVLLLVFGYNFREDMETRWSRES